MINHIGVGIIGCGLIGHKRAAEVVKHSQSILVSVYDTHLQQAEKLAQLYAVKAVSSWQEMIADDRIQVLIVATPNKFLAEIAIPALNKGKHVLIEKPMGRNLTEAMSMSEAAQAGNALLKIGFNHRYHPALLKAHELLKNGEIGKVINIRAHYGHGGRPGYEKEWRGNLEMAGGGELTDQGVHLLDLIHWFMGKMPLSAFAMTQTMVWPIAPLEDNAFALLQYDDGAVVNFHSSWTQWKNEFVFSIFGELGALYINGLGGSYGPEQLTQMKRNPQGGVPEITSEIFVEPDQSWKLEWEDFMNAILNKTAYWGTAEDGLAVMKMLDALYRSSVSHAEVNLT